MYSALHKMAANPNFREFLSNFFPPFSLIRISETPLGHIYAII